MWKSSLAMFLLELVVQEAHPWHTSPSPHETKWHSRENTFNNDIFTNWENRAFHQEAEVKANEQTLATPVRQVSKSTQDLLGVCDCFVSHSERRTGCSYKIGVRSLCFE